MMMNSADSVGKDQPFHLFSSTFRRLTGHSHNIYVATIEKKSSLTTVINVEKLNVFVIFFCFCLFFFYINIWCWVLIMSNSLLNYRFFVLLYAF